jgi:PAS domain S-box-containing protein
MTKCKREQESLSLLAAIVTGSNDAILGKTMDGVVIRLNPPAEAICGYPAGEMIRRFIPTVTPLV